MPTIIKEKAKLCRLKQNNNCEWNFENQLMETINNVWNNNKFNSHTYIRTIYAYY